MGSVSPPFGGRTGEAGEGGSPDSRLATDDSAAKPPYHMPFDEFRRHGHEVVDWVADYLESVAIDPSRPTSSRAT